MKSGVAPAAGAAESAVPTMVSKFTVPGASEPGSNTQSSALHASPLVSDLPAAAQRKLIKNGEKYPAGLVRGSSKKYNEYAVDAGGATGKAKGASEESGEKCGGESES